MNLPKNAIQVKKEKHTEKKLISQVVLDELAWNSLSILVFEF